MRIIIEPEVTILTSLIEPFCTHIMQEKKGDFLHEFLTKYVEIIGDDDDSFTILKHHHHLFQVTTLKRQKSRQMIPKVATNWLISK